MKYIRLYNCLNLTNKLKSHCVMYWCPRNVLNYFELEYSVDNVTVGDK